MDEKRKKSKTSKKVEIEYFDQEDFSDLEKKKLIQYMKEMRTVEIIGDDILIWMN
jgi:hypothetical protein